MFSAITGKFYSQTKHKIASLGSEAIHFRDVEIGVKKIERMSVKNLTRVWGGWKI